MLYSIEVFLGGTFDPIHFGHLYVARAIAHKMKFKKIKFLLNNIPPHRSQPVASSEHRAQMIHLAIHKKSLFSLDTRELKNKNPSWTIDTIQDIRKQYGNKKSLILIMGDDVFLHLNEWKDFDKIFSFCHIVVFNRIADLSRKNEIKITSIKNCFTKNISFLYCKPCGFLFFVHIPLISISSTYIRYCYKYGLKTTNLLPQSVIDYIKINNLY